MPKIKGGYILLSRKLLKSEIMNKPPLYFKLWGWMLLQAKFKSNNKLEEGQFITSISAMREAMSYFIGYRKVTPTAKQIRGIYENLTKGSMIVTTKVTAGLLITILNYKEYQNPKNYEGHNERAHEGNSEGTPYNNKNEKNERKEPPLPPKRENKKVGNFKPTAEKIYSTYLLKISPLRKSKKRAVENIATWLGRGRTDSDLISAIQNYSKIMSEDPKYRKDPANFYGINEDFAFDYLPQNVETPINGKPKPKTVEEREQEEKELFANR